jgi:iron complex outermembrane receptor protein
MPHALPRQPLLLRGLLLAVTLSAWPALAEEPVPEPAREPDWAESLSLEELLELELSAPSKQRQTAREAPGVVSLVTREQIQQFGWESLEDILFSQPGFFPARDYERSVVGARGLTEGWNNNHLLLLVDGVPMNDPELSSAYTWDLTPLFMVKSVEIIRGPGSALYGSSALHGVVALNTLASARTLNENERLEVNSEARLRLGDRRTLTLDVVTATLSEHVSTVLGFRHHQTAGYSYLSPDGSGRTDETGALQRFRIDGGGGSDAVFVKLEARKLLEGLSLQYHLQSWRYNTGIGWLLWAPDVQDRMHERRHVAVLRYRSAPESPLAQEYVLKFQRHDFDLMARLYPSGAVEDGVEYPRGVTEVLETTMDELFGRVQLSGALAERLTLLGGVEYSAFLYGGDAVHYSNVDLTNPEEGFPASDTPVPLGPYFESLVGQPVHSVGGYTQLSWSRVLEQPLSLTVGLRYDSKTFRHRDLEAPGTPLRSKSYEQLSPRLALVYSPSPVLTLKLQASRAFRAPAPAELFGSNTWVLDERIDTLRPEVVTTVDLHADWSLSPHLSWRNTVFASRFENLIGYSPTSLATNLFTRSNAGLESEVLAEVELGEGGQLSAHGNYSYVRMLSEADASGGPVERAGRLTWAPAHLARAGVAWRRERFSAALQGRFQGSVLRRESDRETPLYREVRPEVVPAWVRFDVNARYQLNTWVAVGLDVHNLLDAESFLIKTGDFPFDYRMEGRRIFGSVEINL